MGSPYEQSLVGDSSIVKILALREIDLVLHLRYGEYPKSPVNNGIFNCSMFAFYVMVPIVTEFLESFMCVQGLYTLPISCTQ